jgi:hypothetical protein
VLASVCDCLSPRRRPSLKMVIFRRDQGFLIVYVHVMFSGTQSAIRPERFAMHQPLLTMASYIVVPFSAGRHGELVPGRTQNLIDRHQAVLAASKMSRYRAGVLVLEQIADLEGKRWPEPKLVAAFGRIPQDVVDALEMDEPLAA